MNENLVTIMDKATGLCRAEKYAEAIDLLNEGIKLSPACTPFLILKAQAIQLLDKGHEKYGDLETVKEILESVVKLDEHSIEGIIELAHLLYSVDDNPKLALKYARFALKLSEEFKNECEDLIRECTEEIKG
jgi:tetratricopeptide (TPR) repeat protein